MKDKPRDGDVKKKLEKGRLSKLCYIYVYKNVSLSLSIHIYVYVYAHMYTHYIKSTCTFDMHLLYSYIILGMLQRQWVAHRRILTGGIICLEFCFKNSFWLLYKWVEQEWRKGGSFRRLFIVQERNGWGNYLKKSYGS